MIKALIIDDEQDARFLLRNMISKNFKNALEVIGEATDVSSGITAIRKLKPEIVFLDIKMPDGTGFDVLDKIKEEVHFEVIFITAHDKFAIKAFQFCAFGYLLKPIKISDMEPIIKRLETHLNVNKKGTEQRLKVLVDSYKYGLKKIVITSMEGFKVINIDEIIRLEADGNYTELTLTNNRKLTTTKTIGAYEELLHEHGFFRVHQSTVINLQMVKGYKKTDEQIEMTDGKLVKLSRHRKSDFLRSFL